MVKTHNFSVAGTPHSFPNTGGTTNLVDLPLSNTPADWVNSVNSGVGYANINLTISINSAINDDSLTLELRVMNPNTSSYYISDNIFGDPIVLGPYTLNDAIGGSFSPSIIGEYLNQAAANATKAQWDAAVLRINQNYASNMKADGGFATIHSASVSVDYNELVVGGGVVPKVWDGSQLRPATSVRVWDGSALRPATSIDVWDGSQLRPAVLP